MSAPVDVLAVLDRVINCDDITDGEIIEARAAVAELIESARELDEELDGPAIAHRLRTALARVGGES